MNNSTKQHNDTHINIQSSADDPNPNTPLLHLQASYLSATSTSIRYFRLCLKYCALDHSSPCGKFLSYLAFFVFTILVPTITSFSINVPNVSFSFNLLVQFPESGLTAIAFFTLLCFFRNYTLRQLLFLDGLLDDSIFVARGYMRQLDKSFRYLAFILLPSLVAELVHKIIFFSSAGIHPRLSQLLPGVALNWIMFVLVLCSWVYRTGVFLLVCVMFRMTCELQRLRFQGLIKMFDDCRSDIADAIFSEHVRIKKQVSFMSHRYRFFIIASLVVITVSEFAALAMLLASKWDKSFINSGDLLVCSAVELSGFFLCVIGAVRITHRAQGMVSVATKWHMGLTSAAVSTKCNNESNRSNSDSSDHDVLGCAHHQGCSYNTRQALVAYLQHNNRGITLYGYALDRGLLHTVFAFEFSLVMWILSKVVVLSS